MTDIQKIIISNASNIVQLFDNWRKVVDICIERKAGPETYLYQCAREMEAKIDELARILQKLERMDNGND